MYQFVLKKSLTMILALLILTSSTSSVIGDQVLDNEINGDNYENLYSQFHNNLFYELGVGEYVNSPSTRVYNAIDQALGMITFVQLYDVFQNQAFLDRAKSLADVVYTNFQDPRFELISNYYDSSQKILGNYRFAIDNFLIAWALDDLVSRVNQTDLLLVRDYTTRAESIANELENFVNEDFFIESYRVDNPILSSKFNAYNNLMLSFIVLESESELFQPFKDQVADIFNFINSNLSSDDGGIYSLYSNGFHDDIITLRNTALFALVGFELYSITQDTNYLNMARRSLNFIKDNFADLGVTRGYFETMAGGKLVQLSKSLFSHSLLLLAFLKSANLGDFDSKLDLRSMWEIINNYFRSDIQNELFYSTIDRSGNPASLQSRSLDNLLMIFTLSRLSTISNIKFNEEVDFRDKATFRISHIIPKNVTSTLTLKFDGEIKKSVNITGTGELITTEFSVNLERPNSDSKNQFFSVQLSTLNLVFDSASGSFKIKAKVGIELSASAITLFSAVLIIFLVLLVNELSKTKLNQPASR
ncbi:MAG: hypothetical protein GPJ54_18790 [Candidatus Heimdallarchaeota archaeon]|nr:hypothetical protein [Candidatus Heimdallarchaeota archaeon]